MWCRSVRQEERAATRGGLHGMQTPTRYMTHAETWNIRDRTNQCPPVRVVAYPQVASTPHSNHAKVEAPLAVAIPFRIASDLPNPTGPCVAARGDCEWTGSAANVNRTVASNARRRGNLNLGLVLMLYFLFCVTCSALREARHNALGQARRSADSGSTERRNPASPVPSG
jgi:hypothetical protein